MPKVGSINVGSAILCELIRPEANNKLSILGVFTGDVIFAEFPALMAPALYVELMPKRLGKHTFEVRLSEPGGNQCGLRSEMMIASAVQTALPLPPMAILVTGPGEVIFEMKVDESGWVTLLKRKVSLGHVEGFSTPESSQSDQIADVVEN